MSENFVLRKIKKNILLLSMKVKSVSYKQCQIEVAYARSAGIETNSQYYTGNKEQNNFNEPKFS
jgi:hypothetical protein